MVMSYGSEGLLAYLHELWRQCKNTEIQRFVLCLFITVMTGLIAYGMRQGVFPPLHAIALSWALAAIGIVLAEKLYERWRFTRTRIHEIYRVLDSTSDESMRILAIRGKSDALYHAPLRPIPAQLFRHVLVLVFPIYILLIHLVGG